MERKRFIQNFARRLAQIMREKGYGSSRSKAGIDIKQLAKISGSSYQMARKYGLGQALPEIPVITKIANSLDCSPSWILFGENDINPVKHKSGILIEIEPSLLKYILNKSIHLFFLTVDPENVINFIVETVYDATHLDVDTKTIHKIIDMMISSATFLNKNNLDGNEACN